MKNLVVLLAAVFVSLGTVSCKEEATGNAQGTEVKEDAKEEVKDPVDTTAKASEEKPDTGIVVKETK